jgi:ParB family transcriptional regulator, chromosome partitioning protein
VRRALGKGLSQLIAEQYDAETPEEASSEVELSRISPNSRQPRSYFDEEALAGLAESIRAHGVLQPLVVRPAEAGHFELIAGERRLRAAQLAGRTTVPVVIRNANSKESLELAIVENVQREDINALECARAYRRLIDEFGLTQDLVAQRVGKSRVAIANTIRLLKLPDEIQAAIEIGNLSEGHARALLALPTTDAQLALYRRIIANGLTVREVEAIIRGLGQPATAATKAPLDPNWKAIGSRLTERLGASVKMDKTKTGGRIVVEFYSDDELQGILDRLEIGG